MKAASRDASPHVRTRDRAERNGRFRQGRAADFRGTADFCGTAYSLAVSAAGTAYSLAVSGAGTADSLAVSGAGTADFCGTAYLLAVSAAGTANE